VYAALLGVPPRHDSDDYVGFHEAGPHIRLCRAGAAGVTSPVAFWHVSDIEVKLAEVTAAGATLAEPVRDVGPRPPRGHRQRPDGNIFGLLQDR
jgi:predicted enzyme related to lactoylglutathione lyase